MISEVIPYLLRQIAGGCSGEGTALGSMEDVERIWLRQRSEMFIVLLSILSVYGICVYHAHHAVQCRDR